MCRNLKQGGFSIIMAIFLIVVLGGIAVFMGRVFTMQTQSSALDEEGSMAYQAARTGIEWGIYRAIIVDDGTGSSCIANPAFNLAVPATTTTVNYSVTVVCTSASANEGGTPIRVYNITSTANNAAAIASTFHVQRQLTVTVSR